MNVYIVGTLPEDFDGDVDCIDNKEGDGLVLRRWSLYGVYATMELAQDACKNEAFFVAETPLLTDRREHAPRMLIHWTHEIAGDEGKKLLESLDGEQA